MIKLLGLLMIIFGFGFGMLSCGAMMMSPAGTAGWTSEEYGVLLLSILGIFVGSAFLGGNDKEVEDKDE